VTFGVATEERHDGLTDRSFVGPRGAEETKSHEHKSEQLLDRLDHWLFRLEMD